jgi:hypothetical protein
LSEWNMWVRIIRMKRGRGDIYILMVFVLCGQRSRCGVWGSLAPPPPTFWMCLQKCFHYVSAKFFPALRRLSNLTDRVDIRSF